MKSLKFIPLQLTIVLILGILTNYYFNINEFVIVCSLITLYLILVLSYFLEKRRISYSKAFTISTLLAFYVIGIAAFSIKNKLNKKYHYTTFNFNNDQPKTAVVKLSNELKPSIYYNKFEAKVLQIENSSFYGSILLNIVKDSLNTTLQVGDEILVKARFSTINAPKNPYEFNYKRYLERQNIYRQIVINKYNFLLLTPKQNSRFSFAYQFRKKVNSALLNYNFKKDELSIINALLLGQRQQVSKEILQNYTRAGAIHILAISGLHVGIIMLLVSFVLKPIEYLKNGKLLKLFLVVLFLWLFAIIAGLSASIVRAVTMFTAIAISFLGKKKLNIYNNLIISIFFLLLFNPFYLFNVGFQLSYLAVFFIVWLQPILYKLWIPKFKLVNYFWKIFTVSLAAQIGVLPLSLYYFHQFPGLFFITNLVIIPILGMVLALGFVTIILALLNILPSFIAALFQKIIQTMNQFIAWVAAQESFLFQQIFYSVLLMLASYLVLVLFIRWTEEKSYNRFRLLLYSLIFFQLVFIYENWNASLKKELIVFNKNRQSIIGLRNGKQLTVYQTSNHSIKNDNTITSYMVGANVNSLKAPDTLKKGMLLKNNILLVDSLGFYNFKKLQNKKVLLTHSPKINLERLIKTVKPKEIIADNSNYKSYIHNWEETCKKHNIPFYYTHKFGAYIVKE